MTDLNNTPTEILTRLRNRCKKAGYVATTNSNERFVLPGYRGHYIETGYSTGMVWIRFFRVGVMTKRADLGTESAIQQALADITEWKEHI